MWIGRWTPAAALVERCAWGGRDRLGGLKTSAVSGGPSPSPGEDAGERAETAALGQPQICWRPTTPAFGPEYSGSARLSRVARQLRMVNGESIDISKCRLFLGSSLSVSFREIRITIYESVSVLQHTKVLRIIP